MKKKICIISGGMDSITLLHDVVKKEDRNMVIAITFLYGSKHSSKEQLCAIENTRILKVEHKIIDLRRIFNNFQSALLNHEDSEEIPEGHYENKNMIKTVVPNRNAILLAVAAGFAESLNANTVLYGAHSGDHEIYPDCRKEFIDAFSQAIKLGTYNKIQVEAPYWNMNKTSIIARGIELGVDYSKTWTCYNPQEGQACGRCGSCQERLEAFKNNNLEDPLDYKSREILKKEV
jgi:7-cyano-7-deazaguanine synthase